MKPSLQLRRDAHRARVDIDRERTIDFMGEKARLRHAFAAARHRGFLPRAAAETPGRRRRLGGTRVELDHTGATLMGMKVELQIAIAEVNGRSVTFDVSGSDGIDAICKCRHQRFCGRRGQDRAAAGRQGAEGRPGVSTAAATPLARAACRPTATSAWRPRPADREGAGRRGHRGGAQLLPPRCTPAAARSASRPRADPEDLQPQPRADADEAQQPEEGRDEDPGFVPISWDEAFDLIAAQLNRLRAEGLTDASGYPRLAASFGGGGTPQFYMGTLPASWPPGGRWTWASARARASSATTRAPVRRAVAPRLIVAAADTPSCNYLISCGNNIEAAGGVVGIWRHADARGGHEARAGRAAPVGDRRLLGAMGADRPRPTPPSSTR